jgi:hypothetical protein
VTVLGALAEQPPGSPAAGPASLQEIRAAVRRLPPERRRDVVGALREGRAVRDPRHAVLAAVWAEALVAKAARTPWWLLPLRRPRGWRARLWVVHLVWLAVAISFAYIGLWSVIPGVWRWVVLGFLVYSVLRTPLTFRQMLRAYWNAPEAAERNRQLVDAS